MPQMNIAGCENKIRKEMNILPKSETVTCLSGIAEEEDGSDDAIVPDTNADDDDIEVVFLLGENERLNTLASEAEANAMRKRALENRETVMLVTREAKDPEGFERRHIMKKEVSQVRHVLIITIIGSCS